MGDRERVVGVETAEPLKVEFGDSSDDEAEYKIYCGWHLAQVENAAPVSD